MEDVLLDLRTAAARAHQLLGEDYCTHNIAFELARIADDAVERAELAISEMEAGA